MNKPTKIKKAMFPKYDFSETENYQELWYLDYLNSEQESIYKKHFEENNIENTEDMRSEIVKLLRQRKVYEDG